MTTFLPILVCLFCVFIASYSATIKKTLKQALLAHGYILMRHRSSRRRFAYLPEGMPRASALQSNAFQEVTFADQQGNMVQCLAVVTNIWAGNPVAYFNIDLDTLQPR